MSVANSQFSHFGRFGAAVVGPAATPEFCRAIEQQGYGTVWIVGNPGGDLQQVSRILDVTSSLQVATGIVNIWFDDAPDIAAAYHRIQSEHPGRFWLGVGVGHREHVGDRFVKPYTGMVQYIDRLDECGVPASRRILAALGPKMLALSAERAIGAHPYLVTPAYTARARGKLGSEILLAPEQKVVLAADPLTGRSIARPVVAHPYLNFANYRNNLLSLGYSEDDMENDGSDRLIDDLVPHGEPATVADRLRQHLDNGADHVAIQLLDEPGADLASGYSRLATELFRRPAASGTHT